MNDAARRTGHQVDVAVVGIADGVKAPLLAIGEARWNDTMGLGRLERLRHIRTIITTAGRYDTRATRLICFGGAGFTSDLRHLADRDESVQLIDLRRLYAGR